MEQNRTQKGREMAVHKSTHKASERSAIWAQTEGGKRFGGGVSQAHRAKADHLRIWLPFWARWKTKWFWPETLGSWKSAGGMGFRQRLGVM